MQKFTPFLMFIGRAEEAINLYTSVFENSSVGHVQRYGTGEGVEEGKVMHATFFLNGQEFMCIDSSDIHDFTFTPSMSIYVRCESEAELDRVFEQLSQGGQVMMPLDSYPFMGKYAWFADRFGVSWQISFNEGGEA